MSELQREHERGEHVAPSKVSVAEYLTRWLAGKRASIRGSTWKTYDVAVRVHTAPRIGAVPLQRLARGDLKTLYAQLGEAGYSKGARRGTGLSPKAVHLVHLCLVKALGDAQADGLVRTNVASGAHKMPSDSAPEMQAWTREELGSFLDHTAGEPDGALWQVLASTGLRRGEALGLRWADVDLEAARLSVRQQLTRQGDRLTFGPPKTRAGRRTVALDAATVAALRSQRAAQARDRLLCGPGYQDQDLVFARPDGSPRDPDTVSDAFERATRRAGVKRIRLHDLRHTSATLMLAAGVHPKVVQERLGHTSITVTMDRYSHVTPNMQAEAAERFGRLLARDHS